VDGNPELNSAQPLFDTLSGIEPQNLSERTTR
jgi:hypothetical protein